MRIPLLLVALALPLAACDHIGGINGNSSSPAGVADQTKLDEQLGIVATDGYTAASLLGARLAQAGVINKARFKALDNKGYALVTTIKAAYDAGNSADYLSGIAQLKVVVTDIGNLAK